uniref:endonuclease n=2 Tax=Flavobacterium sp. TaxID=239 RepID=UPI00404B1444
MTRKILLLLFCFVYFNGTAQVVINELDSDTVSIDDMEFVELKSETPFFSLDGYLLVFFNGSSSGGNTSYFSLSLNGLTTDGNGLVLIGNVGVMPYPARIFSDNVIQNGADAVAIYQGSEDDFPPETLATTNNLIDALVYETNDPIAQDLLDLLGVCCQYDESLNGQNATESIQRKEDGTYETKLPTPGMNNDGSGIFYNPISIIASTENVSENGSLSISFSTQQPVENTISFSITLNNGGFTTDDFTGETTITIPIGESTASTLITFVDDELDEGDEELSVKFVMPLPDGFIRMNNNIVIRVVDNDFTQSSWGTPLNPTYGIVTPEIPAGYYDTLIGKAGEELKQALQDIIANPDVVREHTYGDVTDVLYIADQNPENSNQVWQMYVEYPRAKLDYQLTSNNTDKWNREHIYPQSRGGFSNGTESFPTGINNWLPTDADDILAGHSDMHHLRAVDGGENSSRGNDDYGLDDYNGPTGNQGSWKGDVARAVFYMAVRYNVLEVVNGNLDNSTLHQLGDLASLLTWNFEDPSDDFEMNRNNYIYTWQMNRNPFIDYPELANYIWGANVGEVWNPSLNNETFDASQIYFYPNPAENTIQIVNVFETTTLEIYNTSGALIQTKTLQNDAQIELSYPTGMYLVRMIQNNQVITKKLFIR